MGRLHQLTKKKGIVLMGAALLAVGLGLAMTPRPAHAASSVNGCGRLTAEQRITSNDGHYYTVMQGDGNVVTYVGTRGIWAINKAGNNGAYLSMQCDGNLVLVASNGAPLWASGTNGNPGAYLAMQNDGNLTVIAPDGRALWASGGVDSRLDAGQKLMPNQSIQSPDRRYRLTMQYDGNVVVVGPTGAAIWASNTNRYPNATLEMQGDGNLVLYAQGHVAAWATATFSTNSALVGQNDGNFVLYAPGNVTKWSTKTNTSTSATSTTNPTSLTSCPTMRQGSAGPCVAMLQRALNNAGMIPQLGADGLFGAATRQEVIDYQRNRGLNADGVAGPQTLQALATNRPPASVPTPPTTYHPYPSSFSPARAASWAATNSHTRPSDQRDSPCTQFMSRALHAAGMPLDGDWFPDTDAVGLYMNSGKSSAAWYGVQAFKSRMLSKGWMSQYSFYPGNNVYPLAVGDILYYEWNGQATVEHVHLAMVTKIENGKIKVTDQGGATEHSPSRDWDIGRLNNNLRTDFPKMRVYVLHWK